jgi:hypothetical protein
MGCVLVVSGWTGMLVTQGGVVMTMSLGRCDQASIECGVLYDSICFWIDDFPRAWNSSPVLPMVKIVVPMGASSMRRTMRV